MRDQATQLRSMVEEIMATPKASATSVATGVTSFAPAAPGFTAVPHRPPRPATRPIRLARAVAICSGKGGVGKSNLAVNLAVALSQRDRKVCLLDADLGLANADVLCNVTPRHTLEHVVAGQCELADVALLAPGGFRLIPGGSGVTKLANLDSRRRLLLLQQLAIIDRVADFILIDTSAGISTNVLGFASSAHRVIVITTPEPTAITDAYGMIKTLLRCLPDKRIDVVVNQVESREEALEVYRRLRRVCLTFMKRAPGFLGEIPADRHVPEAVRARVPFSLYAPGKPATRAVARLARELVGADDPTSSPRRGFFSRMVTALGGKMTRGEGKPSRPTRRNGNKSTRE